MKQSVHLYQFIKDGAKFGGPRSCHMTLELAANFSQSPYKVRFFYLMSSYFHDLMIFSSEIKEQLLNEE